LEESFRICTHHQHYYGDQIKGYEMGVNVARIGKMRNLYKILVEKSERKIPFARHKRRRESNIKMNLKRCGSG